MGRQPQTASEVASATSAHAQVAELVESSVEVEQPWIQLELASTVWVVAWATACRPTGLGRIDRTYLLSSGFNNYKFGLFRQFLYEAFDSNNRLAKLESHFVARIARNMVN